VLGVTLGILATNANAYWVDVPASVCQVRLPGTDNWTYEEGDGPHFLANTSATTSISVVCPRVHSGASVTT